MRRNDIPEYKIWKAMKSRCYAPCNSNMGKYREYGITVCSEWLNDFEAFMKDMGSRPTNKHSIDRIDTLKGYSPENCRWTTQDIQCRNRGVFNLIFTYQGETMVLKDWAKKFNIKYITLHQRICRAKLPFEVAIQEDPYGRKITINNETHTVKEWCKKLNLNSGNVFSRINRGMTPLEALTTPFKRKSKQNASLL